MRETVEERDAHMRKIQRKEQEQAQEQFDTKGYIYYQRIGKLVSCFCGACGESYVGLSKASPDPFEAALQFTIKPAHNKIGTCRRCGYTTKYKARGKIREKFVNAKGRYMIGQRMGKEEFVFRIFKVEQVMYSNRKTEYNYLEYIRVFMSPGKRPQRDYFVFNPWTGKECWIDHNLGGLRNIPTPCDLEISPETRKEIRKTPMFQYVPLPGKEYGPVHYYMAASRYPDFEMIVKSGMEYLARGLIWGTGTGYRSRGKTYYDRLGIRKDRVKDLARKKGDTDILRAYQLERQAGKHWNPKEMEIVLKHAKKENGETIRILSQVYKLTSPVKAERYIQKTIQNEGCGAFQEYIDYIRMRKEAGYDLSNEIILFPRELHRRHNEMILETEVKKMDKRKEEVLEKYPAIAERYSKLSDQYSAAAAGYIIRPAKNAAEIVEEGRILHHCVGGDYYLSRHNTGKSTILFLRSAKEPDIPYITVEIKDEKILQWYGEYDKKPKKDFFDAWLATYTKELEKRKQSKRKGKVIKKAEVAPVQQKGA